MELIREPLNVDFEVDPRPLSEDEKKSISNFIKVDKLKKVKVKARLAKRKPTRLKRK